MSRIKGPLFPFGNKPHHNLSSAGRAASHVSLGLRSRAVGGVSLRTGALAIWGMACCMGCLPAVVVIDRASVIEEESAGQWADIEAAFDLLHADLYPSLAPGLDPAVSPATGSASAVLPGGAVPPAPGLAAPLVPADRSETPAAQGGKP